VPPPSLRDRLSAVDHLKSDATQAQRDKEANARYAAGQYESPNNHKQAKTRILPPPGFRERIEAVTRSRHEIEVVPPDDDSDTHIEPPPAVQRRLHERRASQSAKTADNADNAESAESTEPDDTALSDSDQPHAGEEDTPHESGER
jgi:hypothetical protein